MYLVEEGELVHVVRVPRAMGKVGAGLRVGEMEGNAFLALLRARGVGMVSTLRYPPEGTFIVCT